MELAPECQISLQKSLQLPGRSHSWSPQRRLWEPVTGLMDFHLCRDHQDAGVRARRMLAAASLRTRLLVAKFRTQSNAAKCGGSIRICDLATIPAGDHLVLLYEHGCDFCN
jgi:hypothetical protein